MKNLYLLAMLVFGLFATSCESEDDSSPEVENATLLGRWYEHNYIDDEGEDPPTECEKQEYREFLEDGVFRYKYYYDYSDETSGNEIVCEEDDEREGTWEMESEGVLLIKFGTTTYDEVYRVPYSISGKILTLNRDEGEGPFQELYIKN